MTSYPSGILIVGLGNPGSEYEHTRHNAGFRVIDRFADKNAGPAGLHWKEKFSGRFFSTQISGAKVTLLKPETYMNESGQSVGAASSFFKLQPADICVVYDDMDLPLGTIRFKLGGGDGGHNGLKSVTKHLRSPKYLRLRVGIGRPKIGQNADIEGDLVHSGGPSDWVLGKFSKSETAPLERVIEDSCNALDLLISQGLEMAQNSVNKRQS